MNLRAKSVVNVGAGAVLLGGALLVAFPPFGLSIIQLVLMTIAAAAALSALLAAVPEWGGGRWWRSPFRTSVDRTEPDEPGPRELERLRSMFTGRRHPLAGGLLVPPDLVRVLRGLIRDALEREGFDPEDPASLEMGVRRLSPAIQAVLDHDLSIWPPWYRTQRSSPGEVAGIVHHVLDDLSRLGAAAGPLDGRQPRAS